MRLFFFLLIVLTAGQALADDCVNINRSSWPDKYKTRSAAGAVVILAGEQGIDPALSPGVGTDSGSVYQDGLDRVCVKKRNPGFSMAGVTSGAILQKMQENDALNDDSQKYIERSAEKRALQTEAAETAKNFENLNTKEKDTLLRTLLRIEEIRVQEGKG